MNLHNQQSCYSAFKLEITSTLIYVDLILLMLGIIFSVFVQYPKLSISLFNSLISLIVFQIRNLLYCHYCNPIFKKYVLKTVCFSMSHLFYISYSYTFLYLGTIFILNCIHFFFHTFLIVWSHS